MQGGLDFSPQAAELKQGCDGTGGEGGFLIQAGRDLILSTVQTSSREDWVKNANKKKQQQQSQDVGTQVQAEGGLVLKAGQDLMATAATISSETGSIMLAAGQCVGLPGPQGIVGNPPFAAFGFVQIHRVLA